jgi:hypothetical protein
MNKERLTVFLKGCLLIALFLTSIFNLEVSLADDEESVIGADKVKLSTPVYQVETSLRPPLGKYSYQVSWQGIPAALADLEVKEEESGYTVISTARTNNFVDIFYRLRYSAMGRMTHKFMPLSTDYDHRENSRTKIFAVKFNPDGNIESFYRSIKPSGKNSVEELKFHPNNFTLDPFAAAFLARSLKWQVGTERTFDIFNGKSRYLVTLKCARVGKESVNGDENRDVIVIVPKVRNLTKPKAKQKLNYAEIFVSNDDRRDVLEIVSSVFVGKVRTKLLKFEKRAQG